MIPTPGKGVDAVNFRSLKESESVDISGSRTPTEHSGDVTDKPEDVVDPFGEFNSGILLLLPLHQSVDCVDDSDVTL
jgi:protein-serine/threonine kinase